MQGTKTNRKQAMSRYSLRNQDKIQAHFDKKTLERILSSLTAYFDKGVNAEDINVITGGTYALLCINDIEHTSGIIMFHIISKTYDVYNLAFKEFIN
jgi:hypothetical protein